MYLLIYSSMSRCIDALICGGTAAPRRSARPADGSQRPPSGTTSPRRSWERARVACLREEPPLSPAHRGADGPSGLLRSAEGEADQSVERLGDRPEDRGEEVGRQDQQAEQQEDPVLLEEADDVLARGWQHDRQQGRPVQGRDLPEIGRASCRERV